MPKITAIFLGLVFIFYIFFKDYEHGWILGCLLGWAIGNAIAYLWTYNNIKDESFKESVDKFIIHLNAALDKDTNQCQK